MTSHLHTINTLMLNAMNAKKLASRKTYTLTIVIHVNMIYVLIVKSINTKISKIRRLKLRLI